MDIQLRFNHCHFFASDIAEFAYEEVVEPGQCGATLVFQVRLRDGRYFQISPWNIIVPSDGGLYNRDKDESYSLLKELWRVKRDASAPWYASDAAKQFARRQGIPIEKKKTDLIYPAVIRVPLLNCHASQSKQKMCRPAQCG